MINKHCFPIIFLVFIFSILSCSNVDQTFESWLQKTKIDSKVYVQLEEELKLPEKKELDSLKSLMNEYYAFLDGIDENELSEANQQKRKDILKRINQNNKELYIFNNNALTYEPYLIIEQLSKDKQFTALDKLPAYYDNAIMLLENPSIESIDLSLQKHESFYFYIKNNLPTSKMKSLVLIKIKNFMAYLNSLKFEIRSN